MLILLLIVGNGYFYFSKKALAKKHTSELVSTKQHYEKVAKIALDKNAKEQLSLMLKTFVWAVRSAMIRNNMDEVDQYFTELIQEENIHEIILVDKKGMMLVSTNKKHQSKPFKNFFPTANLSAEDVYFAHSDNGEEYLITAPVLSLNNKLGTLFLVYATNKFELEAAAAVVNPLKNTVSKDTIMPVQTDSPRLDSF
jgi:hypothetical protein